MPESQEERDRRHNQRNREQEEISRDIQDGTNPNVRRIAEEVTRREVAEATVNMRREIVEMMASVGIDVSSYQGRDAHRRKIDLLTDLFDKKGRLQAVMEYVERVVKNREKLGDEGRRTAFDLVKTGLWAVLSFAGGLLASMFYGAHK